MPKIDPKTFAIEMQTLSDRFNHKLSDSVVQGYYRALSSLDENDFKRACQKVFVERRFFPSPLEIIHAALGEPAEAAQREWVIIITAVSHNEKLGDRVTQIARRALTSIGGYVAIREGHGSISMLRRDFLAAYETLLKEEQQQRIYPALAAPKKELEGE